MYQTITEEAARDNRSVVVARRIRDGNIRAFRDRGGNVITAESQAADPRRGYTLGLMLIDGTITQRQHDAGILYAKDMGKFYGVHVGQSPTVRAQNLFGVGGNSNAEPEGVNERSAKARDRAIKLRALLQSTGNIDQGRIIERKIGEVALSDVIEARLWPEHMLLLLRRGLNRLAEHYGV